MEEKRFFEYVSGVPITSRARQDYIPEARSPMLDLRTSPAASERPRTSFPPPIETPSTVIPSSVVTPDTIPYRSTPRRKYRARTTPSPSRRSASRKPSPKKVQTPLIKKITGRSPKKLTMTKSDLVFEKALLQANRTRAKREKETWKRIMQLCGTGKRR